ncbi:Chromatin modification-like protein EAF1 [Tolypocladium ophioglossoides CBS 100239]|uniref:Vacuolar import and degradation protein 21 n=1 Tax=Tolypocladium ophioglossoides (strain CBS 100239) TaxID=1163406 RepID=A0A0L0NDK0_TOLOC|nr:Chromatin modification-like protein EAF1 [Tolypocladium ophioglossoides CBS 100239]
MTEVGHADLSRLLQSKRNDCSAIVTSRKRKLRELFAVATQVNTLPDDGFANPDAPAATAAEWQFLQANDILQGKTLNELNIPARPEPSLEKLKRWIADSVNVAVSHAAVSHASPAPLAGVIQKAASKAQHETPPSDVSLMKNADAVPAARTSTTPNFEAPQPSSQSPLSPGRSAHAKPRLVFTVEPPMTYGPDDATQKPKFRPNGISKDGAATQRATQVKFQPGTKGSPSMNDATMYATKNAPAGPGSGAAAGGGTGGSIGANAAGARTEGNGPLSIKLPVDASKVPEAMSTPGSTAASATTPAVHYASTDTSPDNDGPRYVDIAEPKEPRASNDVKSQRGATDVQDQGLSAEDQLLQESIQSNATVSKPTNEIPPASGAGLDTSATTGTTQPTVTEGAPKPVSASEEAPPSSSTSGVRPPSAEVPDSQGGTPEEMDLDTPEVKPEAQDENVLSSREPNRPAQNASAAPLIEKPPPKEQPQAAERAVTRVSSGAMRLKSVNEIVGGTARSHNTDRDATSKGAHDQLTPVTSTPQSPASRVRNSGAVRKDRIKGHPSTVLFGKQPKRVEDKALVPGHKETVQPSDDYYTPLFVQNFTGSSNWMQPLERILFQANKTISTPDAHLVIQDHQACRVLRRVYHLQQHDKWSLRQPKRCPEPTRPPSQWDVLLQEMKWMRTDFREERKWKMAVARNLVYACAAWHAATPEKRRCLQVAALIPPKPPIAEGDVSMVDADGDCAGSQSTPDLVSSGDVDSPQNVDDLVEVFAETVAPSAIFTLQEEDVVFGLRRTAASDKLLEELPMYGSPLKVPKFDMTGPEYDPDAHWRRPALPLSKYVEGEMKLALPGPPRTRSRFEYENEDSDDEKEGDLVADQLVHNVKLPPSTDEVSLFNPESKHIRDRLHAGHQFRPPSEHPMPTQGFYESRNPSQWTLHEDDELRGLVREYSYNWSLISNMLSTKSSFMAGAERRTPWECFERWINLEGLPADMQKTQYFKAYNSRIEAAQRVIAQQNQLAVQQASASGGTITPVRRRPSIPLRVERRRNQKHLTLFDAMRKLAKKRETALQKQQHSASQNAANKKTNDTVSQRPAKTPRDYSLMRWERDQALAEKMAQYAQRQEAQRRAAMQARAAAQVTGAAGVGVPGQNANHLAGNPAVNGIGRPMSNQLAAAAAAVAASQGRQRMPMQAPTNGVGVAGVAGVAGVQAQMAGGGGLSAPPQMNGAPTAQMQGMQAQQRMPMPNQQPDANLMLRAQRISEQQRAAVQIQQAQQGQQHHPQQQGNVGTPGATGQHNSPPLRNGVNAISQQAFMNSAQAIMASYSTAAANGNGHGSPQANGLHMPSAASAASPGQRVHTQLPPGITAQLNQLEATFRAKHTNLTPEQAPQLATEHLTRAMMAQRQSAMNAAAGATGQTGIANSIAATTSPHQYAALLRQQQQQQAQQQQQLLQQQQQQKSLPQQHHHQPQAQQPQAQQLQAQQPQAQQPQAQQPKQPQHQHNTPSQGTPVPPTATPTAPSASPAQSHQRASSGSATPSAAGK